MPERVGSDLSEKRSLLAVDVQRREKISGRAAGVGRHSGVAVGVFGFCGEVDEQLAERDNIKHGWFAPFQVVSPYRLKSCRSNFSNSLGFARPGTRLSAS